MKYTTVIFDLDGTLVDTASGIEDALIKSIRQVLPGGFSLPEDMRRYLSHPVRKIINNLLPMATPELVMEVEKRFRSIYDTAGWQQTTIYASVKDTLDWLSVQGVTCYIVTNKPHKPTNQMLSKLDMQKFFLGIVSPDLKQPPFRSKADMVEYLIDKYSINRSTSLLVGDSEEDAKAAIVCGLNFAAAAYGYGIDFLADRYPTAGILYHPEDLRRVLSGA